MKRAIIIAIALGLVAALLMIAVAAGLYIFMLPTEQASGPIAAPAVEANNANAVAFSIVPEESEARYIIDEVLQGEPVTVVGKTNQIAGTIAVDPNNPTQSQAGTIRLNARTFATDRDRRDQAVNRFVLNTNQHEFIEFTPTQLSGLPTDVTIGQPFTFQASGNLIIQEVSQPVTFEVTATPVSDTRIEASAATTILRDDYGLTIPSVPFVADVSEDVQLEIDFVATAGS